MTSLVKSLANSSACSKTVLITHSNQDKAIPHLEKILKILKKEKYLQIQKRYTNIWDFFECLQTYKQIIREEQDRGHIYINVSTGSQIMSITGMFACMVWGGAPYYAHIDYDNINEDPAMVYPK